MLDRPCDNCPTLIIKNGEFVADFDHYEKETPGAPPGQYLHIFLCTKCSGNLCKKLQYDGFELVKHHEIIETAKAARP